MHDKQGKNHHQREHAADQHPGLQAVAGLLGHRPDEAGSESAAQIARHGQQGE